MQPTVDEIADGIYRISTWVPDVSPDGFTFNQFLVAGDEPLLFHTGPRGHVPAGRRGGRHGRAGRVAALDHLRPRRVRRVRRDEHVAGGRARTARSPTARSAATCRSTTCATARPGRSRRARCIDLGGKRVRQISTPHVPHGWEAQVLFEETTGTLLCGDLFTQVGTRPGAHHRRRRRAGDGRRGACSTPPAWPRTPASTLRALGDLEPTTLAIMHGSSFQGDGQQALYDLAAAYDAMMVPS